MTVQYPEPIARLIDSYMKLPGIGQNRDTFGILYDRYERRSRQ